MKTKYLILIFLLMVVISCEKAAEVEEPSLEVTLAKATIKEGEEAVFQLDGTAPFVSFYSGQALNDYAFKEDRVVGKGVIKFGLDTYTFSGTQQNQLKIVVSNNFDGVYTIDNLRAATWTDITSKYTLATAENAWAPGGSADISDIIETGKSLYVAFKYTSKPTLEAGVGKIWKLRNITLTNQTEIGTTTLLNLANGGWQLIYDENGVVDVARNSIVASALSFRSNAAPNDQVNHDVWIISKAVRIDANSIGPDRAVNVKSFTEPWTVVWKKAYPVAGTYTATFVGKASNVYGDKELVKQITVNVTK